MILSKRGLPRVVVADDHPALRAGIRVRLEIDQVAQVLAEAVDGSEALELVESLRPDIAVLDVRMPGLDGVEVAEQINLRGLPTHVVLLTGLTDTELVQRALDVGVRGYVDKLSRLDVLVAAIRAVFAGERFVDPGLLANFVAGSRETLSPRELQVLQLAANGKQNKTIALELHLSEETVKSHLRNVMRKLEVQSRTGAVAAAFRRSLIS
jgi:DNA-binding NarL/FixJ family response regulator